MSQGDGRCDAGDDEVACPNALKAGQSGRLSRWTLIKAHDQGWYQKKDGSLFCPEHRPHYAPPWPKKEP